MYIFLKLKVYTTESTHKASLGELNTFATCTVQSGASCTANHGDAHFLAVYGFMKDLT